MVELRHLIKNFCPVFECKEAMSAASRHVDHVSVGRRKKNSDPPLERRRIESQVHDHIVDRSLGASYQLCLWMRFCLIVQTAQSSLFLVERDAALDGQGIQAVLLEFVSAPRPREEAAFVAFRFKVNLKNPRSLRLGEGMGQAGG